MYTRRKLTSECNPLRPRGWRRDYASVLRRFHFFSYGCRKRYHLLHARICWGVVTSGTGDTHLILNQPGGHDPGLTFYGGTVIKYIYIYTYIYIYMFFGGWVP